LSNPSEGSGLSVTVAVRDAVAFYRSTNEYDLFRQNILELIRVHLFLPQLWLRPRAALCESSVAQHIASSDLTGHFEF